MTSIKPPSSGTPGAHAPEHTDAPGGALRTDSTESSSFQSALAEANQANQAQQAQHVAASASTGAVGADPVAQLAHAVERGAVSLEQAVDQLLDQTLERAGKQLSGVQRQELSEMLRDALLNDPTLSALRG